MPSCAVKGCKTNSGNAKERKLKLFSFPNMKEVRDKWIKACKRDYKINEKNARICSKHFKETAFDKPLIQKMLNYSPVNSRKLKPNAIPTEYLPPFAEVDINIGELCEVIENIPEDVNINETVTCAPESAEIILVEEGVMMSEIETVTPVENANSSTSTSYDKIDKTRETWANFLVKFQKLSDENEMINMENKALRLESDKLRQLYEKQLTENVRLRARNQHVVHENQKLCKALKKVKALIDTEDECSIENIDCRVIIHRNVINEEDEMMQS